MKTLIAVDGSADAQAALETAGRWISPVERDLTLLCVAPSGGRRHKEESRHSFENRLLAGAAKVLEEAKVSLPPGAGSVAVRARVGSPAAVILAQAADFDLLVLGDRGQGAPSTAGLGPVAGRVLEHATAAVLIARPLQLGSRETPRALVALDGSRASRQALRILTDAFDIANWEICLMHVVETPWVHLGVEDDWVTASENEQESSEAGQLEREFVREGSDILEAAREHLARRQASASTILAEGDPADEILAEAERGDFDLIVLGSTGSEDLKHRLLGSVSAKVAWNARVSVLVVNEHG